MTTTPGAEKPKLGLLHRSRRKDISIDTEKLVTTELPADGRRIPFLVRPASVDVDLVDWARHERQWIDQTLLEHRAVLFRGFGVSSVEELQRFVAATSDGSPLEYRDRSTPRHTVGEGVYVSTIYPQDQRIRLHNEGTYWQRFAKKIYFCCLQAAEQGGETPIADVRGVLERLNPELRRAFAERGVMYVRNYHQGVGLPWQEVFQSEDRSEVEEYCRRNEIVCEWLGDDRLRTRQVRPAVRRHPDTGEAVWFNHAAFFHITSQETEVRDALLAQFTEAELPYNTYYGDGTPIDPADVEALRRAYEAEKVVFPWRNGDILLLDNLTVAHGREPYRGARQIVVAMTEATEGGATGPSPS